QICAQFFGTNVQVADVGNSFDNGLAGERQQQAQGGVRGGMLWTKIEGPEEVLLCPFSDAGIKELKSHSLAPAFGRGGMVQNRHNRVALPNGEPSPQDDGSKKGEPASFSGNLTPSAK